MHTNIKAVIFDFGGVLLDWDPRNLYRRYFPHDPDAMEQFLNEINFMEWNSHQDKGRPFREATAELAGQFPQYSQLIHAYHEHWEESLVGDIPQSVELLKRLKQKGFPLYALSNWSAETYPIARKRYPFIDVFEDVVISGEVKLIKPDPAIFELLLKRNKLNAGECLLIDDSGKNIVAAKELGFQAIHYQSPGQLKSELSRLGLLE
jgi:2-haloacid dehalogenase